MLLITGKKKLEEKRQHLAIGRKKQKKQKMNQFRKKQKFSKRWNKLNKSKKKNNPKSKR